MQVMDRLKMSKARLCQMEKFKNPYIISIKKSKDAGETKGGIQLIKLVNHDKDNDNINVTLEVTFEDRNGKEYKNTQNVSFNPPKAKLINNMIEHDENDENDEKEMEIDFYDNLGIRKTILLCKYVDLMRQWIKWRGKKRYYDGC